MHTYLETDKRDKQMPVPAATDVRQTRKQTHTGTKIIAALPSFTAL